MDFLNLKNFVFVPSPASSLKGKLYELHATASFKNNTFVLIPYQNPQVKNAVPLFFDIGTVSDIEVPAIRTKSEIQLRSHYSQAEYIKKVLELKKQIQLGNIYEINFCMEFFAEDVSVDPMAVFCRLQEIAQAPYAALVKIEDDYIMCASPELFLKKTGNLIESKPIKGTAKRGKDKADDLKQKNNLYNSKKERTENVMAVDVARNDLSHFAKRGSVKVNKLYNIESFETVHQMVSTISCELKEGIGFTDIIRDSFPMASMTGAPKLMAMNLIDQHEQFQRKYYSGTMGFIDAIGDFTLWVIIRSIFYNQKNKRLSLAVGGAITYLSEPEKEYEECLLKANAMLRALDAKF